jgi:hypothetical protein
MQCRPTQTQHPVIHIKSGDQTKDIFIVLSIALVRQSLFIDFNMNRGSSRAAAVLTSSAIVFSSLLALNYQKPVNALATPSFISRSTLSSAKQSASKLAAEKRPGNPFQTLIGDMASSISSSISGGGSGNVNSAQIDSKLNAIVTASWEQIRSDLESKQTDDEKAFRSNVAKGIGAASPLNKIRLHDESNTEDDIRVTFYRDSASWCPCTYRYCIIPETLQMQRCDLSSHIFTAFITVSYL